MFRHTVIIERMSIVMTFLGFHNVLIDAILRHIPYILGSFGGGLFVHIVLIEDMSHCYDISGLHNVSIGCHTKAYPFKFAFTIFSSNVQTSSSAYQAFRLLLLHIRRSDFAFIWVRCLNFICITCASITSSSAYQAFKLCLHMYHMFKLHLHHMC